MSEWTRARLSELADIRFSNVDKKSEAGEAKVRLCNYMDVYSNDYITADLPFMEASATPSEIERFRVEEGDVMLTKDSETPDDIGISAVVTEPIENLICGYHLALLKPDKARIDPVYLSKQLQTSPSVRYFGQRANGSTRYGLSSAAIANLELPLAPLTQQRRIAEILGTVDEAIEQTEALIAKQQKVKAGLMHDLFTRGLSPDGQLRPSRADAPGLYYETRLGWLPKGWDLARLKDKALPGRPHLKTGPFGSSLKGEHWVSEGHPVITIGALGEGELVASELLFVSASTAARLHDYQLSPGDVVFSRVADVGRSAVIEPEHDGWIMSSNLMRISLNPALVSPAYLQAQFSADGRLKAQIRAKVNSGGRDVANGQVLNQLWFAWPQFKEQALAVERISAAAAHHRGLSTHLAKLRQLKQGLMQALLTPPS